MTKRVLVSGGAGYIGSVLVGMLLERGWAVRVLDRLYWGESPLSPWRDRIELVQADVREVPDKVLQNVDGVIHLAGLSNDPTAEYNPDANWQMNALATQRLAEACKRTGVGRFVFGSSCSIYDGLPSGPSYNEETSVQPKGPYATSKHYAEQALLELADDAFDPVILRQATVHGLSTRMRFDLVVNTFVKDAVQNGHLLLHGGGWMWRPLVSIRDAAMAQITCLEAPKDKVHAQVFNVVQDNYQIRELAMLVAGSAQMRKYSVSLTDAPLPSIVRDYKCDNSKLRSVLGFAPQITVLESVEEMLHWIERDGFVDFNHPQYYNIRWMTLLEELRPQFSKFATVF
jgi:nucleoside-diphosphate-sugar epimerase